METLPVEDLTEVQLYSCPWEGCVKTFQRHCNLEQHLLYGKCEMEVERYSLLDMAKLMYNEQLVQGSSEHPHIPGPALTLSTLQENLEEGWALESAKSTVRFNVNQKTYLDDKFGIGQQTGKKAVPTQVSQDMRHAKNVEGTRRFTVDDISSYPTSRENKMAAESFSIAKNLVLSILAAFLGHTYNT